MGADAAAAIEELCAAAAAGDLARLQAALAATPAGLSLNTLNRRRLAPLHCAVNGGSTDCVRALVGAGAGVDVREGDEGKTALHLATQSGEQSLVFTLLDLGAAVDAAENDGWTAAMTAAYHGEEAILRMLLAEGADVEAAASCRRRAAHLAAAAGEAGCLAELLCAGATIACVDEEGGTPLHAAAAAGQLPAIRCLLEAGADPAARDRSGRTPAEVAAAAGHSAAAEELAKLAPAAQVAAAQPPALPRADSGNIEAANHSELPAGAALLGQTIRVWWHERQEWVEGLVLEFFAANRVHLVECTGVAPRMQLQRMRLEHEQVELVSAAGGLSSGRQQQQNGLAELQRLAL